MAKGCATKEPGVLVGRSAQTLLLRTLNVPSYHQTEPSNCFPVFCDWFLTSSGTFCPSFQLKTPRQRAPPASNCLTSGTHWCELEPTAGLLSLNLPLHWFGTMCDRRNLICSVLMHHSMIQKEVWKRAPHLPPLTDHSSHEAVGQSLFPTDGVWRPTYLTSPSQPWLYHPPPSPAGTQRHTRRNVMNWDLFKINFIATFSALFMFRSNSKAIAKVAQSRWGMECEGRQWWTGWTQFTT